MSFMVAARWWPVLFLALLGPAPACGDGKLHITLERPSARELDPLDDPRLAKFSLRVVQGGQATDQDAFRGNEEELLVGQVPTDVPFDLRLAGKSATDDMLGLGLVLDVPPVGAGSTVQVKFRKPIGFVGGGGALQVLDAAGEAGSVELAAVPVGGVLELAATPTGAWLLALAKDRLVPVRTLDHQVRDSAPLETAGSCMGVSPDSRTAVVCHAASAVSLVPLDQIGSPGVQSRKIDLSGGRPGRVAFASNRRHAWVLVDRLTAGQACPGQKSALVQLDLAESRELRRVDLDRPISDLAIDPREGTLLLSLPCEQGGARVGWLQGEAVLAGPATPGAYDLVLTDRGLITIGVLAGRPLKAQAQIFDLSKGGLEAAPQTRDFVFAPLIVQFTNDPAVPGFFAWLSEGQQLRITEVAMAADGRRALALFWAKFKSDMTFGSCHFAAEVDADGYLLMDVASGTQLLQRYTRLAFQGCSANCLYDENKRSMADPAVCEKKLRGLMREAGLLLTPEFVPSSAALLFGGT